MASPEPTGPIPLAPGSGGSRKALPDPERSSPGIPRDAQASAARRTAAGDRCGRTSWIASRSWRRASTCPWTGRRSAWPTPIACAAFSRLLGSARSWCRHMTSWSRAAISTPWFRTSGGGATREDGAREPLACRDRQAEDPDGSRRHGRPVQGGPTLARMASRSRFARQEEIDRLLNGEILGI